MLSVFRAADRGMFRLINRRLRVRRFDPLMIVATDAGTKSSAWIAVAAVLVTLGSKRDRREAVVCVGATLTAQGIVNIAMKPMARRQRPFQQHRLRASVLVKPPREHSWPSGHAASTAAAVTTLMAAYPQQALALAVTGLAIAYSRVYVGVHYPFDVASGTAIGVTVGLAWVAVERNLVGRRAAGET